MSAKQRSRNGMGSCLATFLGLVTLGVAVGLTVWAFPWGFIMFCFLVLAICLMIAGEEFYLRHPRLIVAVGTTLVVSSLAIVGMMVAFLSDDEAFLAFFMGQEEAKEFIHSSASLGIPAYLGMAAGGSLLALADGLALFTKLGVARRHRQ